MYGWSATVAFGAVTVSLLEGWTAWATVVAAVVLLSFATLLLPRIERSIRAGRGARQRASKPGASTLRTL